MTIEQLKKELGLTNTEIAEFFELTAGAYANSSAKKRYAEAKSQNVKEIWKQLQEIYFNNIYWTLTFLWSMSFYYFFLKHLKFVNLTFQNQPT